MLVSYHEWFLNKVGRYFAFLSSRNHISLRKEGMFDKAFLPKILLSHSKQEEN